VTKAKPEISDHSITKKQLQTITAVIPETSDKKQYMKPETTAIPEGSDHSNNGFVTTTKKETKGTR
jgi:hypothetical protein